ncbi:MAG: protease pro-enzyme activation domain-containing protein [Xanthobacteraceae bacterium]
MNRRKLIERLGITGVMLAIAALSLALRPSAYAQTPPVAAAAAQALPMITAAVNDAVRATLAGNTRPEATAANDRGRVDDAMPLDHMQLQLRRPAAREEAVKALIEQLHDPKSPNFHHWLTAAEFGAQFSPAASDIAAITGWLQQQGFTVNFVYPSGVSIDYSGTAGQVRTAFHTELHRLSVNGVAHFANMSDPEIPAALAPAVVGVVSLHDFKARSHRVPKSDHPNASLGSGNFSVTPSDLATIYNFNPLFNAGYSGQGQTIAVVEPTNLASAADWTTFRQTFGLSRYTAASLTTINPPPPSGKTNCANPPVINEDTGEAALDVEYASAGAPSAAIIVAACKGTDTIDPELVAIQNLTNSPTHPNIISDSYGFCEAENGAADTAAFGAIFQQGVAEGISYFVAGGDQDASSCDGDGGGTPYTTIHGIGVDAQASTPYAVATGGTDFSDTYFETSRTYWSSTNSPSYGSALSYIPEIPWNDTCASELTAIWFFGSNKTYGADGSCNRLGHFYLSNTGGSGGPSACASGKPAVFGVVGGTCQGWPKPSWQSGFLGNPADGVRDIPDVSLFASDYAWNHIYIYCNSAYAPCGSDVSQWSTSGGTSFTAPILAGVQALVNQYTGSAQGLPNYVYYKIAAAEYGATGNSNCDSSKGNAVDAGCIFYDVTLGDNNAPCVADSGVFYNCYDPSGAIGVMSTDNNAYRPAYKTHVGWDFATGLGTVNVYNLVTNWVVAGGGSASLTVSVTGSGTVTSNPVGIDCPSTCSQTFAGGPQVTLTATPSGGGDWVFSGWSGACSGAGPCTVTMATAQSVTATFVQGYTLTVDVSGGAGGGTVTGSPAGISCPSTCTDGFPAGTSVTLTAAPASGWSFSGWISGSVTGGFGSPCSGAGTGPCTVTMNAATSVTAIFTQITYPLLVSVFGNGTVTSSPSGITCGTTCSSNFASGTQVTLTATPAQGAVFNGWGGVCSGTKNCVVTMNAAANLSAAFSGNGMPQTIQTWVSAASGSDSNPCTRTAPCLTFAAALAQTAAGGEIDVLDPGDFGAVTITKAIRIDGDAAEDPGAAAAPGTSGIVISAGTDDAIDLRGLTFDGLGATGMSGVVFNSGARLHIQNCVIQGFATSGITFAPGASSAGVAQLSVHDTTIIGNATGIWVEPTGGIAADVTLDRVDIDHNNGDGLRVDGSAASGAINVAVTDSSVSFNASNGIDALSGPGNVTVSIMRVVASANGVAGIAAHQTSGGIASVTVGSSGLYGNTVAAQATGGAGLLSYSNNQVTGNATNGSFTAAASLH